MNYIRHLNTFFSCLQQDNRLTAFHISLYIALFQVWNRNHFQSPFVAQREELMLLSKIGSKNTYYKCLKELHQAGYIRQQRAPAKYMPVKITVIRLDKLQDNNSSQQADLFVTTSLLNGAASDTINDTSSLKTNTATVPNLSQPNPITGTGTVSNMVLYNTINNKQENELNGAPTEADEKNRDTQETTGFISQPANNTGTNQTDPAGGSNLVQAGEKAHCKPLLLDVQLFFQQHNYPELEAQKFFHHYQCNGWLVGGKTPMLNWQSSAHNWMLRVKDFSKSNQASSHLLNNQKDYSEPL